MTELKIELTPFQADIVSKIRAMKKLTETTGFRTNRSRAELLGKLNAEDLAAVAQRLEALEQ
jgi:hypothetical protein